MKQTIFKLPLVIGVAGGTSCGKTTIVNSIIDKLNTNAKKRDRPGKIVHLEMHSFYKELDDDKKQLVKEGKFNFDHPDAIDFDLCARTLQQMIEGKTVQIAKYDMKTSTYIGHETVEPSEVIIIEGILLLYDEKVRKCLGVKLFVEQNAETRLRTRLEKYIKEYKRSAVAEINIYTDFVKPAFEEFCRPTKKFADVIVPRGSDNKVAIELVAINLQEMFRKLVVSAAIGGYVEGSGDILSDDSDEYGSQNGYRRAVSRPH